MAARAGCRRTLRRKRRVDVDGVVEGAGRALWIDLVGQLGKVRQDRPDAGLRRIRAIEPLRAVRIEIEIAAAVGARLRVRVVNRGGGRRRDGAVSVAVAKVYLVSEAERNGIRSSAAHHGLMIVVANRVLVRSEERRVGKEC